LDVFPFEELGIFLSVDQASHMGELFETGLKFLLGLAMGSFLPLQYDFVLLKLILEFFDKISNDGFFIVLMVFYHHFLVDSDHIVKVIFLVV
jgi:hypothetical protein